MSGRIGASEKRLQIGSASTSPRLRGEVEIRGSEFRVRGNIRGPGVSFQINCRSILDSSTARLLKRPLTRSLRDRPLPASGPRLQIARGSPLRLLHHFGDRLDEG